MNYSLKDQIVTVTASGVAYPLNIGTMEFSLDNPRWSKNSDNSKGAVVFTERPDWNAFTVTLNIPQQDVSNVFLRRFMSQTVSFTWKDASGTGLMHSSSAKINFINKSAELEPGNTQWQVIGMIDPSSFEPGCNIEATLLKLTGVEDLKNLFRI